MRKQCRASKVLWSIERVNRYTIFSQAGIGQANGVAGYSLNPRLDAWQAKRREFIKVGLIKPMHIKASGHAESLNPSTVFKITAYDEQGKAHDFESLNPRAVPLKSRMLNVFADLTSHKVTAIRLDFDGGLVEEQNIDAIVFRTPTIWLFQNFPLPKQQQGIMIEPLGKEWTASSKNWTRCFRPMAKPCSSVGRTIRIISVVLKTWRIFGILTSMTKGHWTIPATYLTLIMKRPTLSTAFKRQHPMARAWLWCWAQSHRRQTKPWLAFPLVPISMASGRNPKDLS